MDTQADTCCVGANCKLVSFYDYVCEVSPFLDLYQPVKEIPVAHVSAVWMEPTTFRKYFTVGDQFLWFVKIMNHSLINANQVRAFNTSVNANPFDEIFFEI